MATNNSLNIPQGNGEILIGSDGNPPISSLITGSGAVTVVPGPGTLIIDVPSTGYNVIVLPTNAVGPIQISNKNLYVPTNPTNPVVFFLPNSPIPGEIYRISGYGGGITSWGLYINAPGQTIFMGNTSTISDIGSTSPWDDVEIICITPTVFKAIPLFGTPVLT